MLNSPTAKSVVREDERRRLVDGRCPGSRGWVGTLPGMQRQGVESGGTRSPMLVVGHHEMLSRLAPPRLGPPSGRLWLPVSTRRRASLTNPGDHKSASTTGGAAHAVSPSDAEPTRFQPFLTRWMGESCSSPWLAIEDNRRLSRLGWVGALPDGSLPCASAVEGSPRVCYVAGAVERCAGMVTQTGQALRSPRARRSTHERSRRLRRRY